MKWRPFCLGLNVLNNNNLIHQKLWWCSAQATPHQWRASLSLIRRPMSRDEWGKICDLCLEYARLFTDEIHDVISYRIYMLVSKTCLRIMWSVPGRCQGTNKQMVQSFFHINLTHWPLGDFNLILDEEQFHSKFQSCILYNEFEYVIFISITTKFPRTQWVNASFWYHVLIIHPFTLTHWGWELFYEALTRT